jgi:hypothetical protein
MFENFQHFYGTMRGVCGADVAIGAWILAHLSAFSSRFSDLLSRLKVDSLKEYRAIAQEKYRQYLGLYVKGVLGQPLENLSVSVERTVPATRSPESF